MKTMRVVLEIDVDDLAPAQRDEEARGMDLPGGWCLPTLADTTAEQAASVLAGPIDDETNDALFEGTDFMVRLTEARVVVAVWVDDAPAECSCPTECDCQAARPLRQQELALNIFNKKRTSHGMSPVTWDRLGDTHQDWAMQWAAEFTKTHGRGVLMMSNTCPVHNDRPDPSPTCRVHGEDRL